MNLVSLGDTVRLAEEKRTISMTVLDLAGMMRGCSPLVAISLFRTRAISYTNMCTAGSLPRFGWMRHIEVLPFDKETVGFATQERYLKRYRGLSLGSDQPIKEVTDKGV